VKYVVDYILDTCRLILYTNVVDILILVIYELVGCFVCIV